MSTPAAVAQHALEQAQTASLCGDDKWAFLTLLSALYHIASSGKRGDQRWLGLLADPGFCEVRQKK